MQVFCRLPILPAWHPDVKKMKTLNQQCAELQGDPVSKRPTASTATLPILGVCGLSGSGKTTLIEALLPELVLRGLRVAVVKHDCRNLVVDIPGKDSDRLYRSGADVFLLGGEEFVRRHGESGENLALQLSQLARSYDLVLVEGHGRTPVAKLWLLGDNESEVSSDVEAIVRVFPRGPERAAEVLDFLLSWLQEIWRQTPLWACVLIGGRSSRMGRPKHLIEKGNSAQAGPLRQERAPRATWLEHTVALLQPLVGENIALSGGGQVPESLAHLTRIPDIPEARGPLTGILAAMRWQPAVSWLLLACDMPDISGDALTWLLGRRHPGCWGVVPRLQEDGYVEPLLAHYDYRCAPLFEGLLASGSLRIGQIARQDKIDTPLVPPELRASWHNINTPQELAVSRHAGAV
jgi:molybdopterin-guanine dinucleotide biosynthesis protein MobB